jgi:hypothetical protein
MRPAASQREAWTAQQEFRELTGFGLLHHEGTKNTKDRKNRVIDPIIRIMKAFLPSLLLATVLTSCGGGTRKLDEAVFYDGPEFKLKLVRYYENLPLHYTGVVYRVMCGSAATANSPAHKTQDAGWVTVGNGGAIGSKSAAELVERVRDNYRVIDERTLVWTGNGFQISYDACGQFRSWYPTSLPRERIDTVPKPEWCAPKGTGDCRHYDFMGDRTPRFESVEVRPGGRVSFVARSAAFKPAGVIRIESSDSGRSWTREGNRQ